MLSSGKAPTAGCKCVPGGGGGVLMRGRGGSTTFYLNVQYTILARNKWCYFSLCFCVYK
jgi:hypothetical protein